MKKTIGAILAILVLLNVAACNGGSSNDDPNLGKWIGQSAEAFGIKVSVEEILGGGITIELKTNGNCTMEIDGELSNGKWTLEGDVLTVTEGSDTLTGRIDGHAMTLDLEDGLVTILFYKEGTFSEVTRIEPSDTQGGEIEVSVPPSEPPTEAPATEEPPIIPTPIIIDERNVDMWIAYLMVTGGYELDIYDAYKEGASIDLRATGDCTLMFDGGSDEYKWTQVGNRVTFSSGSIEYSGTINGDIMEFNLTEGMVIVFGREGTIDYSPKEEPITDPSTEPYQDPSGMTDSERLALWDGHYYGTWFVYNANEPYEEVKGTFEDVYAIIRTGDNNTATVYLWTMYLELGTVDIEINLNGGGAMGSAISTGGVLFEYPVAPRDWEFRPSDCVYDNMIEIREIWVDIDSDWIDYEILLRPWGMDWEDVDEIDQPYHYGWYLDVLHENMLDVIIRLGEYMHSAFS